MKTKKKKWKKIIYAINFILILLDIFLLFFLVLMLYFSFSKKSNIIVQPTTVTVKKKLSDVIKTTDLGEFLTKSLSNPTEQQIKDKLKELNPQLDITKINVTNITENSARIISNNNTFYSGNPINVNYTVSIQSINW